MVTYGDAVSHSVSDSVSTISRRMKRTGGVTQRHDHASCPPAVEGKRPEHRCRGRFQGTVDITVDGKTHRQYVYGRTQQIVGKKVAVLTKARDEGTAVTGTVTVAAWMATWIERKSKPPKALKPQTLRGYRSKIDRYIVPSLGRHKLTDLRAHHIDAMYDGMRERDLAEATLRQTHAILKKALADARRKGLLNADPIANADAPETTTNDRQALTLAEGKAALTEAGDDAIWWLGLFCGMRQGEVLGLRWQDIDWARGVLTIVQTLQTDTDGRLTFGTPKSKAGSRSWPMPPKVEARLKLHWIASGQPRDGLVFARLDSSPIRPRDHWQAWRDLLERAGQPRVSLHSARQTAASLMEDAGVPDRRAAQILGHSTVQITHGYQRAEFDRIREDWANMDRVLELGPANT